MDEKLINDLANGNFNDIHIEKWFKDNKFDYLLALIEGAKKVEDARILFLVSKYAHYYLMQAEKTKSAIRMASDDLKALIEKITQAVASLGIENCCNIVTHLYTSEIDEVRFYCASNLDYRIFLLDDCPRVAKIAKSRQDVAIKLNDNEANDRVLFIKEALDMGLIDIIKVQDDALEDNEVKIYLHGLLLQPSLQNATIDNDILELQDNTVLASILDDLFQNKTITFNESWLIEIKGIPRKREL